MKKSIQLLSNLLLTTTTTTSRHQLLGRSGVAEVSSLGITALSTPHIVRAANTMGSSSTLLDATKSDAAKEQDECSSSSDSFVTSLAELSSYTPIVIEGMGYYDPRDPQIVASNIVKGIQKHIEQQPPSKNSKPFLVISQGDPLHDRGISAITPLVAQELSRSQRGLVCLDSNLASYHSPNADRTGVIAEIRYSQLVQLLDPDKYEQLQHEIKQHITKLNEGRAEIGKPPVKDYFETFALLQEVTKWGLRKHCGGDIIVAHTSAEINPFSVTSFYEVGLKLGLYSSNDIVSYVNDKNAEESLDFQSIDPR